MIKTFSQFLAEEEASKGTYSSLVLSEKSKQKLHAWVKSQDITNSAEADSYHCTINYSRKAVPAIAELKPTLPIKAKVKGWDLLGPAGEKNVLVLLLDSSAATDLFKETKELGAISDYPEFIVHVTIAAPFTGQLPTKYPKFTLVFDEFKVEELDVNLRAVDTKKG